MEVEYAYTQMVYSFILWQHIYRMRGPVSFVRQSPSFQIWCLVSAVFWCSCVRMHGVVRKNQGASMQQYQVYLFLKFALQVNISSNCIMSRRIIMSNNPNWYKWWLFDNTGSKWLHQHGHYSWHLQAVKHIEGMKIIIYHQSHPTYTIESCEYLIIAH